jgi:phosphoserine aminotransferase
MTTRPHNFSAGPAAFPPEVLRQVADEMLNWGGSGMGVMEMSHRGKHFSSIHERALKGFRELMAVPDDFHVLFMQGGGLGENALVPMNLLGGAAQGKAVHVVQTGVWSKKSAAEAAKYAVVKTAAATDGRNGIPSASAWALDDPAYVHLCSNETINGLEMAELPDLKALGCDAPLVVDFSSHVLTRAVDWSRVGVAFAGAQKNIGPAGLTIVVVRRDLLDRALPICPSAFHYRTVAENDSLYNTPPTFAIYVAGLVFDWVKAQGGVAEMSKRADAKSQALYAAIDGSQLYTNPIHTSCRSRMNVPFFLRDESLNAAFLQGAEARGLLQLKGHKSVGGMRASLYNATALPAVHDLVAYMAAFEQNPGAHHA